MRHAAVACAVLAACVAAGCGAGAGESPEGARLLVTQDFGRRTLQQLDAPRLGGEDTVMRLLQRNAAVGTRFGGGFVQKIDGVSGGRRGGRSVDWFLYVNGRSAPKGAAATDVHDGDRVWWDHHEWGDGQPSAVVGSFPEPFRHGLDGKRMPVRVECVEQQSAPCRAVRDALVALGVPAARGGIARSLALDTLRVLVGAWPRLRPDDAAAQLGEGPDVSGVFARVAADGRAIALLDDRSREVLTLRAGAGLIAATAVEGGRPVWVVTGTDDAGLAAAAGAFDEGTLSGRFAVAVAGGRAVALPVAPEG